MRRHNTALNGTGDNSRASPISARLFSGGVK
jgi:hypothetical protein